MLVLCILFISRFYLNYDVYDLYDKYVSKQVTTIIYYVLKVENNEKWFIYIEKKHTSHWTHYIKKYLLIKFPIRLSWYLVCAKW